MAFFPPDNEFPPVPSICHGETISTPSLFNLTGKTALVTGGNGGIGSGMARGLAEAGADIIIIQIPGEVSSVAEQLRADTGRRVDVYECDLAKSDAIRKTLDGILKRDQRSVDILCNVAGISGGFVPVLTETDAHRELVVQIHYHAVYVLSQLVGRHMAERGQGGKIINVASIAAERAMTRFSVYGPVKAAVGQLTNSLANELAIYNIQVNVLCPGWIHTPMSDRSFGDEEASNRILKTIPAGRWGKPSDFKGVTVFLASAASDYVTGARIHVSGGTHGM
ncbi:hypothetical protein B0J15DRAFT_396811 [Fusarium solani]|uniref:2-deoxy-D-gluconate 3-dehydrogenase n=1 Tax=Fusarium solani TaxID=169388 RepID=A0A9P9KBE0_FUSSL|nr:uncharacterized protein B0J15DRAFT_396811 [Fusarium solani]KAH7254953.1 hypothetical protein B0J15DRAFT_396811 [Fusarium solani]